VNKPLPTIETAIFCLLAFFTLVPLGQGGIGKNYPYSKSISQLNTNCLQFNEKHHFPDYAFGAFPIGNLVDSLAADGSKTTEYRNSDITVQFEGGTFGRMISFTNESCRKASAALAYSVIKPPAWTESKAVALAREWTGLFWYLPPDLSFGQAQAKFFYQFGPKGEGTWYVYLMRTTKAGIPFFSDHRVVQLSESQGPFYAYFSRLSDFTEPAFEPILKEEALQRGASALEKIRKWKPGAESLGGRPRMVGEPVMNGMVVNPNRLTERKNVQEAAAMEEPKARLAWVISYKMRNTTETKSQITGTIKSPLSDVTVFIDAQTGEFLGDYL